MNTLILAFGLFCLSMADDAQRLKNFSVGYDTFTSNIYKQLLKSNSGNFIMCPLSVDTILALVTSGARGQTAEELKTALRLPENENFLQTFKALSPYLRGNDQYDLTSANKVYLKEGFQISDDFKSVAEDVFDSEIENVDFLKNVEAASKINRWVEDKTHDKIKNLIQSSALSAGTRAVLVNAIYFHADWLHKFRITDNFVRPFHVNNNHQVNATLMSQTNAFAYYESEELKAKLLRLDYKGGDVSMHIVLPNDVEGLAALEEKMEDALVPPEYSYVLVDVELPKFKIETEIKFKPILQAIGAKVAFENGANFQGIAANGDNLKISEVVQKAFIEVQEEGTTAAAATAVIMDTHSAIIHRPQPKLFIADHPFLFYLRLNKPGINFSVGRYTSP